MQDNPDLDSAALFEDQWALYRKVIDHNYMGHDEILTVVRGILGNREATGRLLDLGCGDAELASRYLKDASVREYHGVDRAGKPLAYAREKLAGLPVLQAFYEEDQSNFADVMEHHFDVVVLGFALHHNSLEEKAALLAAIRQRLNAGGELIVYDTFLPDGCDRARYFADYLRWVRDDWTRLSPAEYEMVESHIRGFDFPERPETLEKLGRDAGYSAVEECATLRDGFHRVFRFAC